MDLKHVATATGGTLVVAESTPITTLAIELKGFFTVSEVMVHKDVSEIKFYCDRIEGTCTLSRKGLEVAAKSRLNKPQDMKIYVKYNSMSKSDFGDLTDALIKFHELVSSFISVGGLA